MILGDFRADGWYLSSKEREESRIRSDKNFHWLIGDNVDTMAKTSDHHAYDRFVTKLLWQDIQLWSEVYMHSLSA